MEENKEKEKSTVFDEIQRIHNVSDLYGEVKKLIPHFQNDVLDEYVKISMALDQ